MACNFTTKLNKDLNSLYISALKEIPRYGVTFNGTSQGGTFSLTLYGGEISGEFKVSGSFVDWQIRKKPFVLPCIVIKNFIENYI